MKHKNSRIGSILSIVACLSYPNITLALSCIDWSISQYAMIDNQNFVALKVINIGELEVINKEELIGGSSYNSYIDAEITQEFITTENINSVIRIEFFDYFDLLRNKFTKNPEVITILNKSENKFSISPCTPTIPIENGFIVGKTGINILDSSTNDVSINDFKLAINSYKQGIASADLVCKSNNSYCTKTKATYDIETKILNLPTVQYYQFGVPVYIKAKMKKISDNPMNFTIIESK